MGAGACASQGAVKTVPTVDPSPPPTAQQCILLTGGAGYIGSHTVAALVSCGFRVAVMDNLMNSSPKVMERLQEITGREIPLFPVDMCDAGAVDALFAGNRFDAVIHFAGLKAVGESVANPLLYYNNNIVGTLNLVDAMLKHGCQVLVFSSSATVYLPSDDPLDESKPLGCSNPYGWTKFMIEQILQDTVHANQNFAASLLRYFNPVGAHVSSKMGESPAAFPNNLMPFLQQVAVGKRDFLSIFGNDYDTRDGTGVRDYLHVEDLAEGHVKALQHLVKMGRGVIVHNLGSGRGYSVLELVNAFEAASGKPIRYKIVDRRPGDLATVVANATKAKQELGWVAERTVDDMCRSAWKWQSENPHGYYRSEQEAQQQKNTRAPLRISRLAPQVLEMPLPAKHILCTGGAGYIGSHTVVKLLEGGYQVSIMDNFQTSSRNVLARLQEITGKPVKIFDVDMCQAADVDFVFSREKFDAVIHFAGLKAVGESVSKPSLYYRNNIVGTLNIVQSMAKYGCKAMVFSSSATVYKPSAEPLDEAKPLGCSNPYGWTKYMIEQLLQDAAVADGCLAVSLLRYFNPVGAHPSGRIGESPTAHPNNLMPFVQQVAIGKRDCLSVFGGDYNTPDGTGVRDYIHVDDLAEGHICALKYLLELGSGVTIHNLGSGNGHSVLDLVKEFEAASGRPLPYKIVDRRAGDLARVVANSDKAFKDFGWKVKRTLADMCSSSWKWQSENPNGYEVAQPGSSL